MRVVVVGQGYVGLPLAIAAAKSGHFVTGIDTNIKLVEMLSGGRSTISDVSNHDIASTQVSGHYSISSDFAVIADAEIIIICVPTPLDKKRQPDLSYLENALKAVGRHLAPNTLVINESTIAPGTTRKVVAPILEESGIPFELAYSPERIDPANPKWNVTNTPKLVAGLTDAATKRAEEFYKTFISEVGTGSSLEVIETAKLLENSFRLINISFINELAQICAQLNIDVREVIDAAATKPYGFMPFYPSAGVGGHCIPVDPVYLAAKANELGTPSRFIELAQEINLQIPDYFVGVATRLLGSLAGKKILVVGVAYKPNVADTRETPAEGLIETLRRAGADVEWHDDLVQEWNSETSTPLSDSFDLAILVNPHSDTDFSLLGSTPVLNTRGGY